MNFVSFIVASYIVENGEALSDFYKKKWNNAALYGI